MSQKVLRMAAILMCLAFMVSLVPALGAAEVKGTKAASLSALKQSLRILSFVFPLLTPLVDTIRDNSRAMDKLDSERNLNMSKKPTDEATSIDPKTKP